MWGRRVLFSCDEAARSEVWWCFTPTHGQESWQSSLWACYGERMVLRKCGTGVWICFPGPRPCESDAQCLLSETWLRFRPDGLILHLRAPSPHSPDLSLFSPLSSLPPFPPQWCLSFNFSLLLPLSCFCCFLWTLFSSVSCSAFFSSQRLLYFIVDVLHFLSFLLLFNLHSCVKEEKSLSERG